jgi:C4-dicarboxylate transporter DctM subunit
MTGTSLFSIFALAAVAAVVGIPIAFAFALAAAFGLYFSLGGVQPVLNLLQQSALAGIKDYNFAVIPMFTVMGLLIAQSGAAADLFNVVNRRLSRLPGRLAIATVGGNAIFAAVTGVGAAAAAAFSHIAYPQMRAQGYPRSFATGCIAGSAVLGLLIPPSIFMIVWAFLTEQSVGKLFAAGVVPGLLLAGMYALYCYLRARATPALRSIESPQGALSPASAQPGEALGVWGVAALVAVVLGGIWSGTLTPTEGSAFGLAGALVLAVAKGLRMQGVVRAFLDAGRAITPVLVLISCAIIYTKFLALEGVPEQVMDIMRGMGLGPHGTLLFMVVVWFLLGCLIDSISIMLLTVPVFWPIASRLGFEPITFALVGILVIEAGVLTPPFGMNCFVVKSAISDRELTMRDVFLGAAPYWLMILLLALLVAVFPPLATWLPNAF